MQEPVQPVVLEKRPVLSVVKVDSSVKRRALIDQEENAKPVQKEVSSTEKDQKLSKKNAEAEPQRNVQGDSETEPVLGSVFAKTEFTGVLKAPYVKLTIRLIEKVRDDEGSELAAITEEDKLSSDKDKEKVLQEDETFAIYIGDKQGKKYPWRDRSVEAGYFLIDLEPGIYRIERIAIPVGSTLAEEKISLVFEVVAEKVNYLGTLRVVGTKERIKLGGVPVLRPGFEYTADVINEFDEAKMNFETQFISGQDKKTIQKLLMVLEGQNEQSAETGN